MIQGDCELKFIHEWVELLVVHIVVYVVSFRSLNFTKIDIEEFKVKAVQDERY